MTYRLSSATEHLRSPPADPARAARTFPSLAQDEMAISPKRTTVSASLTILADVSENRHSFSRNPHATVVSTVSTLSP